ncbi:GNAT family N-acetyltransferase [Methylomonas sp. 2BW1-5-20]|uniref:GNAT family N-acetyltransferase n=1 Tax=Methylomonas sp. 2BW1-5-20 TaxID=3376686 RepID=UPI00405104EB
MTMYFIQRYTGFDELPNRYAPLLESAGQAGLFFEADWFALLMRHIFHRHEKLHIYAVEEAGTGLPLLLAPLRYSNTDGAIRGARVAASASHPENYAETALIFAPDMERSSEVLAALFRTLKSGTQAVAERTDIIRLWPLAEDSGLAEAVDAALRDAGFWVQRYANSYNRFEATAGLDYETYFAQRSANLRYNVRRRQRALEKSGQLELLLYTEPAELETAMADYVAVTLGSWKKPSTMMSDDIRELIILAAAKGCLRLGVLRFDGVAAAVQLWIVTGGVAHCARLAYQEAHKHLAVGVVLTNFMIAHVLDRDRVRKIDFGFGDEDYKSGWMKDVHHYSGVMAFNPATRAGSYQAAKHILGRSLKRRVKQVLRVAGWR